MENKQITTFEQATSLTGKKALEFFSDPENIAPIIDEIKAEAYKSVPVVTTKKGRDEIGSTALKVSKSRKYIEEAIDGSISDLKKKVKAATDVKKLVIEELNEVRRKVLEPRDEWQKKQDEIEAARVAAIKKKIEDISHIGNFELSETKEQIANRIDALENIDVGEFFEEFTADASNVIKHAVSGLNERIVAIIEEQRMKQQAEQLEQEKKKSAIQDRISNLVQIPLGMMGKDSQEITKKIHSIKSFDVVEADFFERTEEANTLKDNVLSQLQHLLDQALIAENFKKEEQAKRETVEASKTEAAPEYMPSVPGQPEVLQQIQNAVPKAQDTDILGDPVQDESHSLLEDLSRWCEMMGISEHSKEGLIEILEEHGVNI